mgnify:CR=1 FL=1
MKIAVVSLALASCLLTSCYMRTPKQESWTNPEFKNRSIGKTLVMGNADSQSLRHQYEALFVQHLLPYVSAGPYHESIDIKGKIERDQLEKLLQENDIQTVIVTTLMDGDQKSETIVTGYDATPYDSGYWGYYDWGYTLSANTATVSSYMEFSLETNVYDVESKKLIWTGRKRIFDDRSDTDNMNLIILDVIHDLKKQGMLN